MALHKYIINTAWGDVFGTDSDEYVKQYLEDEESIVIRTSDGMLLMGTTVSPIPTVPAAEKSCPDHNKAV